MAHMLYQTLPLEKILVPIELVGREAPQKVWRLVENRKISCLFDP
jgi:hypothetical protein